MPMAKERHMKSSRARVLYRELSDAKSHELGVPMPMPIAGCIPPRPRPPTRARAAAAAPGCFASSAPEAAAWPWLALAADPDSTPLLTRDSVGEWARVNPWAEYGARTRRGWCFLCLAVLPAVVFPLLLFSELRGRSSRLLLGQRGAAAIYKAAGGRAMRSGRARRRTSAASAREIF